MKINRLVPVISFCIVSLLIACGKEQPKQISGVLTFVAGETSLNGKPAATGAKVQKGDRIETKENSCAVIQFFDSSLITLHEKTSVSIETLIARSEANGGKNEISIYQDKGTTFSKIMKNEASFSTRTKTTIAAVRGTAYTFTVDGKSENADIRLLHGKVDVLPGEKTNAVETETLVDGEKIIAAGNAGKARKSSLSSKENRKLAVLDTIHILTSDRIIKGDYKPEEVVPEDALGMLVETDEDKIVYKHIHYMGRIYNTHVTYDVYKTVPVKTGNARPAGKNSSGASKNKSAPKPSVTSLDTSPAKDSVLAGETKQDMKKKTNGDLAAKYGKLSTIYTTDGREYVGVFRQSGNTIELITVEGTVKIPTSEVKKVAPYNL